MIPKFPDDFIWGAEASSYQIEGAWNEDGKGPSIWDTFSHTPGRIQDGSTGDVACDHYHRWPEDVALMKHIGLKSYRFSTSWSRILPQGRGRINQAGIDFYSRLVDGLLEAGIMPFATLYHWDLPQALQDAGGWPNRAVIDAFVEYTEAISRALGDRVKHWSTFNEPWVSVFVGHLWGGHAPGHQSTDEALRAAHHHLLAHGRAVAVLRSNVPGAQVGLVSNAPPMHPASRSAADRAAAWLEDGFNLRWFLDPISGRGYPWEVIEARNWSMDFVRPGDLDEIAVPTDYLGVNYYTRQIVRSAVPEAQNLPREVFQNSHFTANHWEIYPPGLLEILARIHFDYRFPAYYITENGMANDDTVGPDGQVNDQPRIDFLREHLGYAARAVAAGIPLKGYFVWSILDNFEWLQGYAQRFGLVYMDYATQRRIPKASAEWYRRVIAAGGLAEQANLY